MTSEPAIKSRHISGSTTVAAKTASRALICARRASGVIEGRRSSGVMGLVRTSTVALGGWRGASSLDVAGSSERKRLPGHESQGVETLGLQLAGAGTLRRAEPGQVAEQRALLRVAAREAALEDRQRVGAEARDQGQRDARVRAVVVVLEVLEQHGQRALARDFRMLRGEDADR